MSKSSNPTDVSHDASDVTDLELTDDDLENVAGGGEISDCIGLLIDNWSDIKNGYLDAMND